MAPCRPVDYFRSLDFWVGVAVGALLRLLAGKFMGFLVF